MNIVFDFVNELVEWNAPRLVQTHYLSADGRAHFPDALAGTLINHPDWLEFDRGLIDTRTLAERSAIRLGLSFAGMHEFIANIPHVLPIFTSTVALMQALATGKHGTHRVLYLSNMPAEFAHVLEQRCPWIGQFEAGIFSGRAKLIKPDPAIYAAAESELKLTPADTLFLDDSAANVNAARERGWHAELIVEPHNATSARKALIKHGILNASLA